MEKIKRHYDFLGRELLWAGRHKLTGEIIRVVMDDIDNNLYYVYLGDTGYDEDDNSYTEKIIRMTDNRREALDYAKEQAEPTPLYR